MWSRWVISFFMIAALVSPSTASDSPPRPQPMSPQTRMLVIRSLTAEVVFVRHLLPQGEHGITLKDGQIVAPSESELTQLVATYGSAAKPGDRAQISRVAIKENKILFELNGGPKKKTKWYQHISVSGVGGTAQPSDDATKNPNGSR